MSGEHQQCLTSTIKQIPRTKTSLASRTEINKKKQLELKMCFDRLESENQQVDKVHEGYMETNSRKENMNTKCRKMREDGKKLAEHFSIGSERIENIVKMLCDIQKRIEEIKAMSLGGCKRMDDNDVYIWRISRLSLLPEESRLIYSDRVQSSKWGYEFGMSLEILTNKKGKPDYVILSFIIFQGAYDAILEWPFPYLVTVCLVDVMGNEKHIIYSIQPDSRTAIFGRPIDASNAPYSIAKFCSAEKILDSQSTYVSDDNIFFRLHVDFIKTGKHPL